MDFASVAHDLRTPLNVVLAYVQLLGAEQVSDAGRHRLAVIDTQIRRMVRLLDSCMVGTDRLARLTLIDLHTAIRNVVAEIEALLQQRQIEVLSDVDESLPPMRGDADALHRVLLNVLVNSADAIDGSGRIRVSAHCEARTANEPAVQIEVTDTGTGIPAELIPCVFERGFTTKPSGQGRGLGLGICRDIIQMHGGRMELLSELGKGTTVRLSLPLAN